MIAISSNSPGMDPAATRYKMDSKILVLSAHTSGNDADWILSQMQECLGLVPSGVGIKVFVEAANGGLPTTRKVGMDVRIIGALKDGDIISQLNRAKPFANKDFLEALQAIYEESLVNFASVDPLDSRLAYGGNFPDFSRRFIPEMRSLRDNSPNLSVQYEPSSFQTWSNYLLVDAVMTKMSNMNHQSIDAEISILTKFAETFYRANEERGRLLADAMFKTKQCVTFAIQGKEHKNILTAMLSQYGCCIATRENIQGDGVGENFVPSIIRISNMTDFSFTNPIVKETVLRQAAVMLASSFTPTVGEKTSFSRLKSAATGISCDELFSWLSKCRKSGSDARALAHALISSKLQ